MNQDATPLEQPRPLTLDEMKAIVGGSPKGTWNVSVTLSPKGTWNVSGATYSPKGTW